MLGNLWQRPQLSRRDRSIVTLAVLIARNQAIDLKHYIDVALDSGVTSTEVSEIITHLAFYSGWSNAMSAVAATKDVFKDRGITTDQLPAASPQLLPLNEEAERQRATGVEKNVGPISPGLVQFTTDPLFLDLWQRPGLAPRDRSLVTVSSLIASGQSAQITYHLNRAMDNGLTADEAYEGRCPYGLLRLAGRTPSLHRRLSERCCVAGRSEAPACSESTPVRRKGVRRACWSRVDCYHFIGRRL